MYKFITFNNLDFNHQQRLAVLSVEIRKKVVMILIHTARPF
ncbi:MAG: hypothetical protein G01um101493_100 [Microgenomates group bacterium Gr01-1014_93]|nr:MAG: hypothetical protein G01um101493_100 [Microgenomates group bacterium Gr01-1014_93]